MPARPTGSEMVDSYFKKYEGIALERLRQIRLLVKKLVPDAEEALTYGIPTFKLNGNMVHYAAFEKHIGFYPTPSGIAQFKSELSQFKHAKGSIKFPHTTELPIELIKKIVKFRIEEQKT